MVICIACCNLSCELLAVMIALVLLLCYRTNSYSFDVIFFFYFLVHLEASKLGLQWVLPGKGMGFREVFCKASVMMLENLCVYKSCSFM